MVPVGGKQNLGTPLNKRTLLKSSQETLQHAPVVLKQLRGRAAAVRAAALPPGKEEDDHSGRIAGGGAGSQGGRVSPD